MSRSLEQIVLSNAVALLNNEENWTFGAWARDPRGQRCDPLSPFARQWCAIGALEVTAYNIIGDRAKARSMARKIAEQIAPGPGGLVYINECGRYRAITSVLRSEKHPHAMPTARIYERAGFAEFARRN